MISTHLKRFRLTILAAVALLAIIGTVVTLPDSAEAGRRPLIIKSVDMTITPTAEATRDNKEVDISFTWKAPRRATGYKIDRRHRINVADSPPGEAEWSTWQQIGISTTERSTTIEEMYTFYTAGTHVEWRIKLRTKTTNGACRAISPSVGVSKRSISVTT